jgi:hypothetical protein
MPRASTRSTGDNEYNHYMVSSFYKLNCSVVNEQMTDENMKKYIPSIGGLFRSFLRHRNMLNFIRDLYTMPNVEQNDEYFISVLTLGLLVNNFKIYSKIFNEKDFYLFTGYVTAMRNKVIGFNNIEYYNQHMNGVKEEVGEEKFNSMMSLF